ncbi:MAG TPA: hypothetical protein PLU22_06440, partial [Polyangiaceae bacterium]|nr:hypothetical protein [Polyangiaceae bacterium]
MTAGARGSGAWLRRRLRVSVLAALALLVGCGSPARRPAARAEGARASAARTPPSGPDREAWPWFVLLFIGDGMGPAQIVAAERYHAAAAPAERAG